MRILIHIVLFLAVLCEGCTPKESDGGTPLPRRYAYPRFEPYDSVTVVHSLQDLTYRINHNAVAAEPRDGWTDIVFPRYGATLHLSYNRPADADALVQALANREERMMLNLGDAIGEATDYRTPPGFECRELVATDAAVTPIQFLAVGPGRRMVSGAVVFADTRAAVDSIAPIITALQGEVRTLLQSLTVKK